MEKIPGHSSTLGRMRQFSASIGWVEYIFREVASGTQTLPLGSGRRKPAIRRCCRQSKRRRAVGSSPYHHSFGFRPFPLLLDDDGCKRHQCGGCYHHPNT